MKILYRSSTEQQKDGYNLSAEEAQNKIIFVINSFLDQIILKKKYFPYDSTKKEISFMHCRIESIKISSNHLERYYVTNL